MQSHDTLGLRAEINVVAEDEARSRSGEATWFLTAPPEEVAGESQSPTRDLTSRRGHQ